MLRRTWLGACAALLLITTDSFADDAYLRQSPGANNPGDIGAWRRAEKPGDLHAYPAAPPGTLNPNEPIASFGGSGATSFAGPDLGMPFAAWCTLLRTQREAVDKAAHDNLAARFDLSCRTQASITMSGGKPQPLGPTARLPHGIKTWESYAAMDANAVLGRGDFPYTPLQHPVQSTAHMVFPPTWLAVHPEHARMDVGMDIPQCFLPEYPPPMFLTTHPELGDVTRGVEVTYGNYFDMFNGLLTSEQLDGLRLMVTPFQTTWFNATQHRVTPEPSQGVTCMSCHVNGHTNGAFALAPDSRPNYARLRVDSPTLRGDYAQLLLSSKRAIRQIDHFAEIEEYFDGDSAMLAAIGGRDLQKSATNHMGDMSSIIDFPPAPKLDVFNRLLVAKSTPAELRGEKLFNGKAQCAACHPPVQQFTDNSMHDLKVERFYHGRAEGPIKTFPLRGIKDSPPYLHDGRLLTLEDAVQFFDIVLGTALKADEKRDLTAYLRAL